MSVVMAMVIVGVLMVVVVTMSMSMSMVVSCSAALLLRIRATFGLKGLVHRLHLQAHGAQHVGQHRIGFDLEVVWGQLDGDVAVAQVVGRADQVKRLAVLGVGGDAHELLWRGHHTHPIAVLGHQNVAAAQHLSALQEDRQNAAVLVLGLKAASLAAVPIERDAGCAGKLRWAQAFACDDPL